MVQKRTSKAGKTSSFVIGSARFKKISASPDMKGQLAVSKLKNPTPEAEGHYSSLS
jgi:hypothetical protein